MFVITRCFILICWMNSSFHLKLGLGHRMRCDVQTSDGGIYSQELEICSIVPGTFGTLGAMCSKASKLKIRLQHGTSLLDVQEYLSIQSMIIHRDCSWSLRWLLRKVSLLSSHIERRSLSTIRKHSVSGFYFQVLGVGIFDLKQETMKQSRTCDETIPISEQISPSASPYKCGSCYQSQILKR
jgi:hypothetical protein